MLHLTDFVNWINKEVGGEGPLPELLNASYGEAMSQSLHRHFAEDRQKGGVRMSNLGKPATLLALAKLGYVEPEPKGKSRFIFHLGDVFENFLEVMLQAYGIEILDSQQEVNFMGIIGHLDYIIKSPVTGKPVIVEAKTMSQNYSRLFSQKTDDDRGYVTQLALYANGTGLDATWICFNKGTSELFEVETNPGLFVVSLVRAQDVLNRLANVNTLEDVLHTSGGYFRPPPPQEEKYKGQLTGKRLLPVTFKLSPFKSVLYKITEGMNGYKKDTLYVDDYADVEHMRRELDFLVDTGQLIYNG